MDFDATGPGIGESIPCCTVEFYVTTPGGSFQIHRADCVTNMSIEGLKHDFKTLFNIPVKSQVWKHEGRQLDDKRTLKSYEIEGLVKEVEKIYVTRS